MPCPPGIGRCFRFSERAIWWAPSTIGKPCLVLRPGPVWNHLAEHLREIPNTEPSVQQLQRKILGNAQELSLDANGRILLSRRLRGYAGLKESEKVAVVGLGECLEVWDAKVWDGQMKREVDLIPRSCGICVCEPVSDDVPVRHRSVLLGEAVAAWQSALRALTWMPPLAVAVTLSPYWSGSVQTAVSWPWTRTRLQLPPLPDWRRTSVSCWNAGPFPR